MTRRMAFRADASQTIGIGHVMRCLTLAQEARQWGAEVHFFCREHPGHLLEMIQAQGFHIHPLPLGSPAGTGLYEQWLGATWEEDQAAVMAQAPGPFEWLIVDHYGLDARWEAAMAPIARRVLAIDDLADRPHQCDLLLDQNASAQGSPYRRLCPPGCTLLLGPEYALLRPEFSAARPQARPREEFKHVLVFYGGADLTNETRKALRALRELQRPCRIDVVVGPSNPRCGEVESALQGLDGRLHLGTSDMATLMLRADLSLGAAGSATWERAAVGLPVVATVVADNQVGIGQEINRRGMGISLGTHPEVSERRLVETLENLAQHPEQIRAFSQAALGQVDARGVARVCDRLMEEC